MSGQYLRAFCKFSARLCFSKKNSTAFSLLLITLTTVDGAQIRECSSRFPAADEVLSRTPNKVAFFSLPSRGLVSSRDCLVFGSIAMWVCWENFVGALISGETSFWVYETNFKSPAAALISILENSVMLRALKYSKLCPGLYSFLSKWNHSDGITVKWKPWRQASGDHSRWLPNL